MAVTNQNSDQYQGAFVDTDQTKLRLHEQGGDIKLAYFTHTQSGVGDATSDVILCKLPAGRVRLLGQMSTAYVDWTTASSTLDLGWAAYTGLDGETVAADPNGIDDGIDVDAAGFQTFGAVLTASGGTKVFESSDGVNILATSQDEALADGDTIAGYIAYVAES